MFTNTKRDCSIPELAEFYANCVVTSGIVTSSVNGRDKSILGDEQLLELIRKLAQQLDLTASWSVRKGEMMPLHRLLF